MSTFFVNKTREKPIISRLSTLSVRDHPQMKGNYTKHIGTDTVVRVRDHPQMKGNYTHQTTTMQ